MQPHAAERRHLERQIAYARPIFMVLALVDLLDRPPSERGPHAVLFVTVYLVVSLVLAAGPKSTVDRRVATSSSARFGRAGRVSASDSLRRGVLVRLSVRCPGCRDSMGNAALRHARGRRHAGSSDSNGHERPAGMGSDAVLDCAFHGDICRRRRHVVPRQPPAAPCHRAGVSRATHRAVGSGPRHGGIAAARP